MCKLWLGYCLGIACLTGHAQSDTRNTDAPFALNKDATVVLYGDSITAQNLYTQDIELYTATRFPDRHIDFINSGVGGDRVSGGYGGTIDVRLARDVSPYKPTMVTIMLGMNDGAYQSSTTALETAYSDGYKHLLNSIQSQNPGVQITLLGPSAYDDVTRPAWVPGGYNGVLQHYAELDQQMAKSFHVDFTNLNPAVVAVLQRAQAVDPLLALQLIPDRVHPAALTHWVMAETVLKGWSAPAIVSSVSIDARNAKLNKPAIRSVVSQIVSDAKSLSWSETDEALPLPFNQENAADALLLRLTDIEQKLDQEPLQIVDMEPGTYRLAIDDQGIGTFTSAQLNEGINLAMYKTPMQGQAQNVAWKVTDHIDMRRMDLRLAVTGADPTTLDAIKKYEADAEKSVYDTAKPVPHHYKLEWIGTQL